MLATDRVAVPSSARCLLRVFFAVFSGLTTGMHPVGMAMKLMFSTTFVVQFSLFGFHATFCVCSNNFGQQIGCSKSDDNDGKSDDASSRSCIGRVLC